MRYAAVVQEKISLFSWLIFQLRSVQDSWTINGMINASPFFSSLVEGQEAVLNVEGWDKPIDKFKQT